MTYTWSKYPDSGPTNSKGNCIVQGINIPLAPQQRIDSKDMCDLVVTVHSSFPLNITDTRDCWYYNVYLMNKASYVKQAALALSSLIGMAFY